ncbi:MAG: hypothetical protein J6X38_07030 [Abditibacteriota bacterium]|nr:hypothetical protein [Abditibacteriota bacterium]
MKKNPEARVFGFIALVFFVVGLIFAGRSSMEFDDLATIGMCSKDFSFSQMFAACVVDDRNPILSHIIYFLWFKIAPYGDVWTRLVSVTEVAFGIFICGLLGTRLRNIRVGVLFAVLTGIIVTRYCGYTIRPYGLLFLISSAVMYMYVIRCGEYGEEQMKTQLILGLLYGLLANTHYTGCLIITAFFLADLLMVLLRKSNPIVLVSYALAAVMFMPWLLLGIVIPAARGASFLVSSGASAKGGVSDVAALAQSSLFSGMFAGFQCILLAAFLFFVAELAAILFKGRFSAKRHTACYVFVFALVFMAAVMTIYTMRDMTNSLFAARYFVAVVPVYILCVISGIDMFLVYVTGGEAVAVKRKQAAAALLLAAFVVFLAPVFVRSASRSVHPFRQTTDILLAQKDIGNKDVLVLRRITGCADNSQLKGWKDYYLTRGGKEGAVNVDFRINEDTLKGINKVYFCVIPSYGHVDNEKMFFDTFELTKQLTDGDAEVNVFERRTQQ